MSRSLVVFVVVVVEDTIRRIQQATRAPSVIAAPSWSQLTQSAPVSTFINNTSHFRDLAGPAILGVYADLTRRGGVTAMGIREEVASGHQAAEGAAGPRGKIPKINGERFNLKYFRNE